MLEVFLMGLLGGAHCVGMCGSLCGLFVMQLPENVSRSKMVLCLNLGRLMSYVFLGMVLGGIGELSVAWQGSLRPILFIVAHIVLLLFGLHLTGISGSIRYVEQLGKPLWNYINPYLMRHLPVHTVKTALLAGFLWGFLPCGLVYSAAIYALSTAKAFSGGMAMLIFGLGTLPTLFAVGLFAHFLTDFLKDRFVRIVIGVAMIVWALWQISKVIGSF